MSTPGPTEAEHGPRPSSEGTPRRLLYIMHDYPSVSQTFVVTEAAELDRLGIPVVGYALHRGLAPRPAARVPLVGAPPSWRQLAWAALSAAPGLLALPWRAGARRLSLREAARLVLAHLHATYALRQLPDEGVAHIHAHFLGRSADVAMLMAARLDCEWSATSHAGDAYSPTEPALLERRLATAAAVACASRSVQESVERHAAPRGVRTAVVHCGIDSSAVRLRSARPRAAEAHLVTVGRLVATKGHWTNLEAAASLMNRFPSLRWTVVGDGPLRDQLAMHARRLGLSRRFVFAGALAHDATVSLLRQADGFVLPCEQDERGGSDGIPVALMEAMAVGVPVVTAPVGGIRELVEPDETGFLVPSGDASAVVAAIEHILDEHQQPALECLRIAARTKIEREFDQSQQARVLIELLGPHLD